eukprot:4624222-Lingulodinium_polyedra.AAC.1
MEAAPCHLAAGAIGAVTRPRRIGYVVVEVPYFVPLLFGYGPPLAPEPRRADAAVQCEPFDD